MSTNACCFILFHCYIYPLLENETLFDSRKFREMCDMGRLMEDQFLSLLSYVADQERKKIHQRRAEGIAVAKSQGKHLDVLR